MKKCHSLLVKVWLLVVWCCVWIAVSALAASDSLVQEGNLHGENIGLSFSSPAFAHMFYTALEREGKASNVAVPSSALAAVDSLYIVNGEMAMDIIGLFDISHSECPEMEPLLLKDLNHFPNLEKLSIINTPLRELDVLAQLSHLRSVTLRGCSITDCSFAAALTELSHLELACNEVTDLSPLVNLQSLQVLDVSHCPVAGFEPLMHLENLTHLTCSANSVNMLSQLEMLADRVQISLETNVADLSLLSRIDHLQSLNVHAAVTDLEPLRTMQNLQFLTLEGTKDTVLDLEPLAELKNLQFLCFADEQLVRDASVVSHVPMIYGIAEKKDW